MDGWAYYLSFLAITTLVEAWVAIQLFSSQASGYRRLDLGASIVAVNLFSHSIAWVVLEQGWLGFVSVEVAIIVAEGLLLAGLLRIGMQRGMQLSLVANLATIALSLLI